MKILSVGGLKSGSCDQRHEKQARKGALDYLHWYRERQDLQSSSLFLRLWDLPRERTVWTLALGPPDIALKATRSLSSTLIGRF